MVVESQRGVRNRIPSDSLAALVPPDGGGNIYFRKETRGGRGRRPGEGEDAGGKKGRK